MSLGGFTLKVVEFLATASTELSGFKNDVNQILMEEDILESLLNLSAYFKRSDILNQSVFKIFSNILNSKNEEVAEIIRHVFEETSLLELMSEEGPQVAS